LGCASRNRQCSQAHSHRRSIQSSTLPSRSHNIRTHKFTQL
jgi:hypothetical protein